MSNYAIGTTGQRLQPSQTCSVDGCGRPHKDHGLCAGHRNRQRRGQDINVELMPYGQTLEAALRRHVRIGGPEECWPAKRLQGEGYGQVDALGTSWLAHRAAWTVFVGSITPDIQLHHVCRNRACANPAHLQAVTAEEHALLHAMPACV